jgi:hypothetical protein
MFSCFVVMGVGGESYTLVATLLVSQVSDNIVEKHSQPAYDLLVLACLVAR